MPIVDDMHRKGDSPAKAAKPDFLDLDKQVKRSLISFVCRSFVRLTADRPAACILFNFGCLYQSGDEFFVASSLCP